MSGYKRDVVIRIVPRNGSETVYWLEDRLTDAGGHTRCQVRYPETMIMREDINRNLRPVVFGIRPEVEIEAQILSMADQLCLAEIEDALLRPNAYNVYLSLDGGVVEREVVLGSGSFPDPLRGKTYIGAKFSLAMRCKSLITRKPVMMTDPTIWSEFQGNGAFDDWVSAAVATGWTANANLTFAQEATIKTSGAWSGKGTATGGGYAELRGVGPFLMNPAAWYRFRASSRGGQTTALGFTMNLWNNSYPGSSGASPFGLEANYPGSVVRSWANFGRVRMDLSSSQFNSFDFYFRGPTTPFRSTDEFYLRFDGLQTAGHIGYFDDVSLYGPVLRPGYATW